MSDYDNVSDHLAEVIGRADDSSTGYLYKTEHLTLDQELKVCEIRALLSVARELSSLNPRSVKQRGDDDEWYDGWGNKMPQQK